MNDTPPPSDPETEAQRATATLISSIDVPAPADLRRKVREMTDAAPRARRVPGRPLAWAGALAGAAVVVLVLILALGGGASTTPTVQQASALAQRPATQGAPAESSVPGRLAISAAGIPYPYWGQRFGWQAVGARTDSVGGRMVTTVFYARMGTSSTAGSSTGPPSGASGATPSTSAPTQRIAYSIVAGAPLAVPTAGHSVVSRGTGYRVLASGTAAVVTWRRAGHTCILVGSGVSAHTLLTLARWQAT